jgi:hypothetical protein
MPSFLIRLPSRLVGAALVVRLMDEWWSYLPAGSIEDLRRDIGITYAQAGGLLALLTVGGLLGAPLATLADTGHRRILAVSGAGALTVGLAAYASGAPFIVLAVASTLMGGASDVMIRPLESSLAETAGDGLDKLLARQHIVTWLGDVVGPVVLALGAATVIGWQGSFALTAAAMAVYAVVLARTRFPEPRPRREDDGATGWQIAVRLARRPEVLMLAGAEVIMLALDEAFLGFTIARAVADGQTPAVAQVLAAGIVVGGILGAGAVSRWGLDVRLRRVGGPLLALGALSTAVGPPFAVQVAMLTVMGAGTGIVWAALHHRMLTAVEGRSAMVPTVVSVLATPSLALPVAMGWTADVASITVALMLTAALAVPLAVLVECLLRRPVRA